ncbi:hypothetical protein [Aeromicrobium sp. 179-A 4D2 NHS]|uniref:hypothetical protein n=1 Tax=Aeromicrobium sp. 179-A 4D2 NHS TaxID=3142375 RepID=UPI0039A1FC88
MVGDIDHKHAVIEGLATERYGRNNVSFGEDRATAEYMAALDPDMVKTLVGEVRSARAGRPAVNPDGAVEVLAGHLIGLDHTDDFIRGFGAEMSELDDWEADAARREAREIISLVLDTLGIVTASKES